MPYIKKTEREYYNNIIKELARYDINANGDLNYILYAYFKNYYIKKDISYNRIKNYISELEECIAEIRRTVLAPYEDQKMQENGTI